MTLFYDGVIMDGVRRMWLLTLVVVAAVAAAAASSSSQRVDRVPCPRGSTTGAVLGKGDVNHAEVTINGVPTGAGALIYKGDVICTKAGGLFHFSFQVGDRQADCKLKTNSSLRVNPQAYVLEFIFGTSICWAHGGRHKPYKGPYKLRIITDDPVFGVSIARRRSVVRVFLGSALVSGKSGVKQAVVVGPLQQTVVPAGGNPFAPIRFVPTTQDQVDAKQVGSREPPPDFSRPNADGSANLARIFQQRALAVGFDPSEARDQGTAPFVTSYLNFLASSWGLGLNLQSGPSGTELNLLGKGKLDLVVTSVPLFGFDGLPFFSDSAGRIWSLVINRDSAYKEALRHFLASSVQAQKYESLYQDAFGRAPSYAPLRSVLFPK